MSKRVVVFIGNGQRGHAIWPQLNEVIKYLKKKQLRLFITAGTGKSGTAVRITEAEWLANYLKRSKQVSQLATDKIITVDTDSYLELVESIAEAIKADKASKSQIRVFCSTHNIAEIRTVMPLFSKLKYFIYKTSQ